jgi:cell division protease FtsH
MNRKTKKTLKKLPVKGPNAVWLLLILLGVGFGYLLWYNSVNRNVQEISYSKLIKLVEEDKVNSVVVRDQYVQGKLKNDIAFETYVISTEKMWDLLKAHNVSIVVQPQEKNSWGGSLFYMFLLFLPFILLWALFYFRQKQNGGGGGMGGAGKIFNVGKSKARFISPNAMNVKFGDVAGVEEAKDDLKDIIEFLKNPKKFSRLGAKIPRGVLLTGAPGTGKTLLAKAVSGEAACPFFSTSGSDFVEVFVGVGASRVRDLFVQARKNSPCIVFVDEIDAVGRQRGAGVGGGNDEREQTLNQLLSEMDGFSTEKGAVIVLAATNRPDVLDKALLRPGRFDRILEVPYPDLSSREKILHVHAKNIKLDPAVDLSKIARGTPGFTGADLENLINESALIASRVNKQFVEMKDFELARDKLLVGAERKTMVLTKKEKEQTAYHESGHTLLNILLEDSDPFHKVSIIPRGRALGVSWSLPERDKYSETKKEMLAKIKVLLGGLVVEKIVLDEQTSGAANDIERATKIAQKMVRRYGMSNLGPQVFGENPEHPYLGRDLMKHSADYSEETARKIDEEINRIISVSYKETEKLIVNNRDKLELLAKELLKKETLQAQEVYDLLGIAPRELHKFDDDKKSDG